MVENMMPKARLAAMKTKAATSSSGNAPENGHAKEKIGHDQYQSQLHIADENVRRDFSHQDFQRTRRHGEEIFHRASFPFAGDGQPGNHDHRHGENDPHEARHDVVLGVDLGVVK